MKDRNRPRLLSAPLANERPTDFGDTDNLFHRNNFLHVKQSAIPEYLSQELNPIAKHLR
jgi:hypothetical protein